MFTIYKCMVINFKRIGSIGDAAYMGDKLNIKTITDTYSLTYSIV